MRNFFHSFFRSYSCVVGLIAHVGIALPLLPMLALPAGTAVRPMGWAMLVFHLVPVIFLVGVIMAITDAVHGKTRLALLGFALCSTPYWNAPYILYGMAFLKGLHVAE